MRACIKLYFIFQDSIVIDRKENFCEALKKYEKRFIFATCFLNFNNVLLNIIKTFVSKQSKNKITDCF